jgi:hypothetical protein
MEARLAAVGMMVVMIRAGKPGCRMLFDRSMFAGDRVGRMRGARACGAMTCQSGALTRQSGAARTRRRATTAQSRTRT